VRRAAPPSLSQKEKERRKKEREAAAKADEVQRKATKAFREKMEARLKAFVVQSKERTLTLDPMEKSERAVVHDVAEVAGLVAHSFGQEDEGNRHVVVWKREDSPSEEELVFTTRSSVVRYIVGTTLRHCLFLLKIM